jgi:predicted NAD/FAD-binding protein
MGAAIWSSADQKLLDTPAETFLGFFKNHGLLSLFNRPRWQTVVGGSHAYIKAFLQQFKGDIRLGSPVIGIKRNPDGCLISVGGMTALTEKFDIVVIAVHADLVLKILGEDENYPVSKEEKELFTPWAYHDNYTVLHTDVTYLPPNKNTWASWNYRREVGKDGAAPLSCTYHMNRLQGINSSTEYCVTLNPSRAIQKEKIIAEFNYAHPCYTLESVATQSKIRNLNGKNNTFYCGSYLGYGFHEDAVRSARYVADQLTAKSGQQGLGYVH